MITNVKLDEIPSLLENGTISKEEAVNCIFELLYRNPKRFSLGDLDEDQLSNFLSDIITKISVMLKNYRQDICPFGAYVYDSVNRLKQNWILKLEKDRKVKLYMTPSLYDSYKKRQDDTALETIIHEQPAFRTMTNRRSTPSQLTFRKIFEKPAGHFVRTAQRHESRIALILTLKSSWYIDDSHISKVSKICGLDPEMLYDSVLFLKERLEQKAELHEQLELKRDKAWFLICLYRSQIENADKESVKYEKLRKKLAFQTRVWQRKTEQLRNCRRKISPTNSEIAEIIGISSRKVSFYISKAREMTKE